MEGNEYLNEDERHAVMTLAACASIKPQPGDITSINKVVDISDLLKDELVTGINADKSLVCRSVSPGQAVAFLFKTLGEDIGPADVKPDRVEQTVARLHDNEPPVRRGKFRYLTHLHNSLVITTEARETFVKEGVELKRDTLAEDDYFGDDGVNRGQAYGMKGLRGLALVLEVMVNENPHRAKSGIVPYKMRIARVADTLAFTPYLEV